jgi:diaminopimelate epimerase
MCGNGGRCVTAFAHKLFNGKTEFEFLAYDGLHKASIRGTTNQGLMVQLSMQAVHSIENVNGDFLLDTGSPHFVRFVEDAAVVDVNSEGRKIRNSESYLRDGVNVNFVELHGDSITVRTYERGVEEETLSYRCKAICLLGCPVYYHPYYEKLGYKKGLFLQFTKSKLELKILF